MTFGGVLEGSKGGGGAHSLTRLDPNSVTTTIKCGRNDVTSSVLSYLSKRRGRLLRGITRIRCGLIHRPGGEAEGLLNPSPHTLTHSLELSLSLTLYFISLQYQYFGFMADFIGRFEYL